MNKKIIAITLALFLASCASNNSVPSISQDIDNSESPSLQVTSIVLPGVNSGASTSASTGGNTGNSQSSNLNSSVQNTDKSLSEEDFNVYLMLAIANDQYVSSVDISHYILREKYYQTQNYTMNKYSNNITIYTGQTVNTNYDNYANKLIGKFTEQRMYKDGYYTNIRKFEEHGSETSFFPNTATRALVDESLADYYLHIGQSFSLYSIIQSFKDNYDSLYYEGFINEKNEKTITYLYFDPSTKNDALNMGFCAAIMATIDSDNYLSDFFYTEGYYDLYWCDDVPMMRRHGPDSTLGDGYTYTMTGFQKKAITEYEGELKFKLEDNFINKLEFNKEELHVSMIGDINVDYINLLDYLVCNPTASQRNGCPVNNIKFTSSNETIATIGDQFFADFKSKGETIITVSDSALGVVGQNSLKLIIE